jgi:putative restriction endonuclease
MKDLLDDLLLQIDLMKVNVNNGKPAVKKPLLLLLLISRMEKNSLNYNKVRFVDIEKELGELIINFGGRPTKSGPKANQPFQYMSSSNFWSLSLPVGVEMTHSTDLPLKALRDEHTYANLDEGVFRLLKHSREARALVSDFILTKWWPKTIQEEIISALALPAISRPAEQQLYGSTFAMHVLANYRNRCAICGFDASFNNSTFGLDATSIKWFSQGGPYSMENGLALCKLHHWAFDKGVIGLNPEKLTINISPLFVGKDHLSINMIESFEGREILPFKDIAPSEKYLLWHSDYIFMK